MKKYSDISQSDIENILYSESKGIHFDNLISKYLERAERFDNQNFQQAKSFGINLEV